VQAPPVIVSPRPAEPVVVPPEKLELQLIEGSKTQKVIFEKKGDSAPGPVTSVDKSEKATSTF
jgi:hypothetical protein